MKPGENDESGVILNELKHINKSLEEMKHSYERFEVKLDRFEEKQEKIKEKVDIMDGERGIIKWVVPMGVSAMVAFFVTKIKGG